MASSSLELRIIKYAKRLHQQKSGVSYVSGAEYNRTKKVAKSGDINVSDFTIEMKENLKQFGKIGTKYNKSSIGYCAETVSANRVLVKVHKAISQLSVGKAIRPKTMQVRKKCKICKTLFK